MKVKLATDYLIVWVKWINKGETKEHTHSMEAGSLLLLNRI